MAMPLEYFGFDFALVKHVVPLCLQWQQAQLFLGAWAGGTALCSVNLLRCLWTIETPK
jgi:hypothetical protein